VNADFVVRAIGDPELRTILQEAHLATADGMPLVWAARLLGAPLKGGRVAGSDFVPALMERAAKKGFSVFLLGARPEVAAQAALKLREQYPELKISGVISPPVSPILQMDPSIVDKIKAAKPDILLVAFGNPKQEKWISMYRRQLQVPVMIGVGGTLDFIAGNLKRAPSWMQRTGLEWLFRLLQEPRRLWRRYVVDLVVFSLFFSTHWLGMRRKAHPQRISQNIDLMVVDDTAVIHITGSLTSENIQIFQDIAAQAMSVTAYVIVNLAKADLIDSAGMGTLISLTNQVRDAGGELFLAGACAEIQRMLALFKLEHFFIVFDDLEKGLLEQPYYRAKPVHLAELGEAVSPKRLKEIDWAMIKTPRRLDAATVPAFVDSVAAQLANHPCLILDFSETVFLASAGLAALLHFQQIVSQHHGELLVTHCSKDVLRVIELGEVDRVLSVCQEAHLENC
jgi:N-acetylglucosaminyldiphosphoundecaprenol N-acetyl-beta-D-mannosaminyltransferase